MKLHKCKFLFIQAVLSHYFCSVDKPSYSDSTRDHIHKIHNVLLQCPGEGECNYLWVHMLDQRNPKALAYRSNLQTKSCYEVDKIWCKTKLNFGNKGLFSPQTANTH